MGVLLAAGEKIGQWLNGASEVKISEAIAGHISVAAPCEFPEWRVNCSLFWHCYVCVHRNEEKSGGDSKSIVTKGRPALLH